MKNNVLHIVIDADIARSSSTTEHPVSSHARKVLDEVKSHGHILVMCPKLNEEWKKHRSSYATKWLASMFAKRKVKVKSYNSDTRSHVETNVVDGKIKDIAVKDVHLIDIALSESKIITSNDNNARIAFCEIGKDYKIIQKVIWLHSVTDADFISSYLVKKCVVPETLYLKK